MARNRSPPAPPSGRRSTTASRRASGAAVGNLHRLVTAEPRSPCVPALWRYARGAAASDAGGRADHRAGGDPPRADAENPGSAGQAPITGSLFAGLQLIMPGEIAPAHRHTQSALRFIIEGTAPIPRSMASAP